jgi:hypothetical protein
MASELRVNTLKDASGNNSVATSTVAQGSAKAWVNFNGTGTIAIRESFNTSSLTDNGTGDYDSNLTNSMSNADFSVGATTSFLTGVTHMVHFVPDGADGNNLASAISGVTRRTDSNNLTDLNYIMLQAFGDLA